MTASRRALNSASVSSQPAPAQRAAPARASLRRRRRAERVVGVEARPGQQNARIHPGSRGRRVRGPRKRLRRRVGVGHSPESAGQPGLSKPSTVASMRITSRRRPRASTASRAAPRSPGSGALVGALRSFVEVVGLEHHVAPADHVKAQSSTSRTASLPIPSRAGGQEDAELATQEVVVDPLEAARAHQLAVVGRVNGKGDRLGPVGGSRFGHRVEPLLLALQVHHPAVARPRRTSGSLNQMRRREMLAAQNASAAHPPLTMKS